MEVITFNPDPSQKLVIDRGIAHTFDGLEHIVTRDEPIWYVDEDNPDFNMGSDVVNFPRESSPDLFPVVQPNSLPIPVECYRFITARQHETYPLDGPLSYPVRFAVTVEDETRYVTATPIVENSPLEPTLSTPTLGVPGVLWGRNYLVMSSGPGSYYIAENPNGEILEIIQCVKGRFPIYDARLTPQAERITFMGNPGTTVTAYFIDRRPESPTRDSSFRRSFAVDPRFHLRIEAEIAYRFEGAQDITMRLESMLVSSVTPQSVESATT